MSSRVLPTNDLAFKKILASEDKKDIACGFIKDFWGIDTTEDNLHIGNPYDIKHYREILEETGEGILKLRPTIKDISFSVKAHELLIELQIHTEKFFTERSLYYPFSKFCGNYNREGFMERSKMGKPDRYSSLIPVYSLNILGYNHFIDDKKAYRTYTLYDEENRRNFDKDLIKISYLELYKEELENENQRYWRDFIVSGEIAESAPGYMKEAAMILDYTNLDEEEQRMVDEMEKAQATYDGQLFTAYSEGEEAGIEKGIERGIEHEKLETARKALTQGLSVELVHEITNLDAATIQNINATMPH
jgi:predicted transposase/invertase (TIGR01784 family)